MGVTLVLAGALSVMISGFFCDCTKI
ncbi:MAG: hypothetical protein ACI3ZR_06160 [bacterium]